MKRNTLLKALKNLGCVFVQHGKKHDQYMNPQTGKIDQVPRHKDINELLAKQIIKNLS
jgi:predicted RNA binding protein YcfA (HicA-like mRNA interferase family)